MTLYNLPSFRLILHSANALPLVSVKVQEASKFPDIKIVSLDWLTASTNSKIRADEAQFLFNQTASSQDDTTRSMGPTVSKQNHTKGKGKKRERSPIPVEEEYSDVSEAVEQSPAKKHKDGQKAKSGSLLVPVDEMCPLAGKISPDLILVDLRNMVTDNNRNPSSIHWRGRYDLRCRLDPDKRRAQQ